MMKTVETIKADVFIVPNESYKVSEKTFEWARADYFRVFEANHDKISGDFMDQIWIQIWFATRGDNDQSNWTDHGIDGYKELVGWRPVCQYLPKALFEGHKEGDIITINLPIIKPVELGEGDSYADMYATIKVGLCLKQQDYRYKRFGKFEEVLARV